MCLSVKTPLVLTFVTCLGIFSVGTLLVWPGTALSNETVEGLGEKILSTTQRLEELDAEIRQSQILKEKLDKALKASNDKVNERQTRIDGLKSDINEYNQQLDKLDTKIQEEQSNVDLRKQVLAQSIRRVQRVGSGRGLKVVLQNDNPAAANRIGVYTSYFMGAQQQAIRLNFIKKKATSQYDTYKSERNKNQHSLGEVQAQITNKTRTVATLKVDQARLQALMEELRSAKVAQSGYFISGQGNYPLPVTGAIKARFGEVKKLTTVNRCEQSLMARWSTTTGCKVLGCWSYWTTVTVI